MLKLILWVTLIAVAAYLVLSLINPAGATTQTGIDVFTNMPNFSYTDATQVAESIK